MKTEIQALDNKGIAYCGKNAVKQLVKVINFQQSTFQVESVNCKSTQTHVPSHNSSKRPTSKLKMSVSEIYVPVHMHTRTHTDTTVLYYQINTKDRFQNV